MKKASNLKQLPLSCQKDFPHTTFMVQAKPKTREQRKGDSIPVGTLVIDGVR
jgi:hypothetical protein